MPRSWFPHGGKVRRTLHIALAALLMLTVLVTVRAAPARAQTAPDPGSCDVDVLFILDESGSMQGEGISQIQAGVGGFVDTMTTGAPDSRVGFVEFNTTARIPLGSVWFDVDDPADVTAVDNYLSTGLTGDGWTNWEAALASASTFVANTGDQPQFVFLITDGQPTTYGPGTDTANNATMWEFATVQAEDNYATLAGQSGTIIGLGAGADFVTYSPGAVERLGRVTDQVDIVADLGDLADEIIAYVDQICAPTLTVVKSANPTSLPEPGGDFTLSVTVTNTSASGASIQLTTFTDTVDGEAAVDVADLPGVACEYDDGGAPFDPETDWIDAGDSVTCSWVTTVTGQPGTSEHDTVTAQGTTPTGRQTTPGTDDATVTITDLPSSIEVTKTADDPTSLPEPGGEFTFDVTIENTSVGDTVTITEITDDPYGTLTAPNPGILSSSCTVPQVLAPGGTYDCSFTVEINGDPGQYANTVTASGFDDDQQPVSDEDDASVTITDVLPSITLTKTPSVDLVPPGGGDVTFTLVVTNTSTADAVTIDDLTDDVFADMAAACAPTFIGQTLDPGESASCDYDAFIDADHVNTATVYASDDDDNEVTASDDATVTVSDEEGAIEIDKLVGPLGTPAGSALFADLYVRASNETSVTWQITLTNPTGVSLVDVVLTDDVSPSCVTAFEAAVTQTATGNEMAPGEVLVFTCDQQVGTAPVVNTATAGGLDQWGNQLPVVEDDATTTIVAASGTIGDTVWNDTNENGIQDNGEKGIANAKVQLTLPDGSTATAITNSNGLYLFSALPAGTYKVAVVMSSIPEPTDGTLKLTTPGSFTVNLADGESFLAADFGVVASLPNTGIPSDMIAAIGIALVLAGGLALLATRKKRDDEGPDQMAA